MEFIVDNRGVCGLFKVKREYYDEDNSIKLPKGFIQNPKALGKFLESNILKTDIRKGCYIYTFFDKTVLSHENITKFIDLASVFYDMELGLDDIKFYGNVNSKDYKDSYPMILVYRDLGMFVAPIRLEESDDCINGM